jgi:hypothetical protein
MFDPTKYFEDSKCMNFTDFSKYSGLTDLKVNIPAYEAMLESSILVYPSQESMVKSCESFHKKLCNAVFDKSPFPVVRFADGEYSFYNNSLKCNGLYKQVENYFKLFVYKKLHKKYLIDLSKIGYFAPLINENYIRKKYYFGNPLFKFLNFLTRSSITLSNNNYFPFYFLYKYLFSELFSNFLSNKNVLLINSSFNKEKAYSYFNNSGANNINLKYVKIPAEYASSQIDNILGRVKKMSGENIDIAFVGAGLCALPICVEVSKTLSIPSIDGGHFLNIINSKVESSNGARLFTNRDF